MTRERFVSLLAFVYHTLHRHRQYLLVLLIFLVDMIFCPVAAFAMCALSLLPTLLDLLQIPAHALPDSLQT